MKLRKYSSNWYTKYPDFCTCGELDHDNKKKKSSDDRDEPYENCREKKR